MHEDAADLQTRSIPHLAVDVCAPACSNDLLLTVLGCFGHALHGDSCT
jgi:hypothetical protein